MHRLRTELGYEDKTNGTVGKNVEKLVWNMVDHGVEHLGPWSTVLGLVGP